MKSSDYVATFESLAAPNRLWLRITCTVKGEGEFTKTQCVILYQTVSIQYAVTVWARALFSSSTV